MFLKAIVFLLKMKKLLQIPFLNDEFPPEAMEKFFQGMSLWVFSCNFLKILAKGVPEAMEKFFQDSSLWVSCNFLEDIGQRYAGGYGEIFPGQLFVGFVQFS